MFNLSALVNSQLPTTQDVLNLYNGKRGQRALVPVLELLDGNLAPKLVLDDETNDLTGNGLVLGFAEADNAASTPRLTCDLVLSGAAGPFIDESTDFILVSAVDVDPATLPKTGDYRQATTLAKCPVGVYGFQLVTPVYGDTGIITYNVKGMDPGWILTKLYPEHDWVALVGFPISTMLQVLLRMDSRSPSEGGRAPSGTPYPGSPQASLPLFNPAPYSSNGIPTNALPFTLAANGNYQSPANAYGTQRIEYNPYDKALADASSFYPISPISGQAMRAIPGLSPTYWLDPGLGYYFRSSTGEFFTPFPAGGTQGPALDIFKGAPLPTGLLYKQNDTSNPGMQIGTIPTPLSTWGPTGGYDYDGSGPFYASTTAQNVTTGGSPSAGPTTIYPTGGGNVIAQRSGLGVLSLIAAGTYSADHSTTTTDPAAPSQNVITPNAPTAGKWIYPAPGWIFGAGTCTVTLNVNVSENQSAPSSEGSLAISCLIYEVASGGGTTLRGTLPAGPAQNQVSGELALTCSASLGAFTPAAGSHLRFDVSLIVTGTVTFNGNAALGETGEVLAQSLTATFGVAPTVPAATTYFNAGTPATLTNRMQSGTGITWPDTNDPGLAPSGCEVNGPNWPASRIDIADQTDVLYDTLTWGKQQPLSQYWDQLADAANLEHFHIIPAVPDPAHLTDRSHDTLAVATTQKVPFYVSGPTPTPVRTYSNEASPTDGRWVGVVTENRVDAAGVVNKVTVFSQSNTTGDVIVSTRRNDTNGLYAWNHIHQTLNKIVQDDSIATQGQADDRADLELANGNRGVSGLELVVPFDPLPCTGDPINVIVVNRSTNETLLDGTNDPWFITAIQRQWQDQNGAPIATCRITCAKYVST